jgi:hypothetical protein
MAYNQLDVANKGKVLKALLADNTQFSGIEQHNTQLELFKM